MGFKPAPQVGDWIMMTAAADDPHPIEVGDKGRVESVALLGEKAYQLNVAWLSGRTLMVIECDPFGVIDEPEVPVLLQPCPVCGNAARVYLTGDEYLAVQSGALIQNALPSRDASFRELFITGIHEHCGFDIFGGSDS